MRCTIVLEFDDGEGLEVKRVELMRLHRARANCDGCMPSWAQ
jgi:hypothetical protein